MQDNGIVPLAFLPYLRKKKESSFKLKLYQPLPHKYAVPFISMDEILKWYTQLLSNSLNDEKVCSPPCILKISIMVISQLWEEEDGEMGKDQGPKQSFLILL